MDVIIKKVHVSYLVRGDTVRICGVDETFDRSHLKHDSFTGYTYNGRRCPFGMITKVTKKIKTMNGFRYE